MRHHTSRVIRAVLLCASMLLAATTAPASARALPGALAPLSAPTAFPAPPTTSADVNGTGQWETASCLLCGGAVLGLGGATVAGLFFLAAVLPEAVAGCMTICAIAYAVH